MFSIMKRIRLFMFMVVFIIAYSCKKDKDETINYPTSGQFGFNIIDKTRTEYPTGYSSLCVHLPEGTSMKVRISGINWFYSVSQDWSSWKKSDWNSIDNSRDFTSLKSGDLDFQVRLESGNTVITVFENNTIEATWTKTITVQ